MNPEEVKKESAVESREKLKNNLGLVLCTRQKNGQRLLVKDQAEMAEQINLASVQFDFRGQTEEQISAGWDALLKLRVEHPQMNISIHGETPKFDEETLEIKNKERVSAELKAAELLGVTEYTVHPLPIGQKLFDSLPAETKDKLINNYCKTLGESVVEMIAIGKTIPLSIENMSGEGVDGLYGQKVEELVLLLEKIKAYLIGRGLSADEVEKNLGITFDINHALHNIPAEDYEKVLRPWFENLKDKIKVIHLYAPSAVNPDYQNKYKLVLDLASEFSPQAKLFLESKQSPEVTNAIFTETKKID
ncbi:MAG: hypothetical protein WCP24_00990 [bacterium]